MAEAVQRLQGPPGWVLPEPYRSKLWEALGYTSDGLTTLLVEMYAGGMAQRDLASALEQALCQCVLSKHAMSNITERLTHAYETFQKKEDGMVKVVLTP